MSEKDTFDFQKLCTPGLKAGIGKEAVAVVARAEEHFNHKRDQLRQVTQLRDAKIQLNDLVLEPGTDMHAGFVAGVSTALEIMGAFPLKLKDSEGEDQ